MGIPRVTGKTVPCGYCEATGRVSSGYGGYAKTACPICMGRGEISVLPAAQKCRGCNGTGRQRDRYLETVVETLRPEWLVGIGHGTGWVTRPTLHPKLQR